MQRAGGQMQGAAGTASHASLPAVVARPPAAAAAPNNQTCAPVDAVHQSKNHAEPGLPPPHLQYLMPWLQESDRRHALAYTEQHSCRHAVAKAVLFNFQGAALA